jgi:hypothetical protein
MAFSRSSCGFNKSLLQGTFRTRNIVQYILVEDLIGFPKTVHTHRMTSGISVRMHLRFSFRVQRRYFSLFSIILLGWFVHHSSTEYCGGFGAARVRMFYDSGRQPRWNYHEEQLVIRSQVTSMRSKCSACHLTHIGNARRDYRRVWTRTLSSPTWRNRCGGNAGHSSAEPGQADWCMHADSSRATYHISVLCHRECVFLS